MSAAKVTAADAANLLIAIMGSPISGAAIKEAAKTCKSYGGLRRVVTGRRQKDRFHPFNKLTNLPVEHCLREALAALIEDAYVIADAPVVIKVDSCPTPGGEIHVPLSESENMAVLRYSSLNKSRPEAAGAGQTDLIQSRFVSFDTVKRLAAIVRSGEKQDRRAFHG